jgi:hypothetical protein
MAVLALPWPAWHTDTKEAISRLFGFSDRELIEAERQNDAFQEAHRRGGSADWRATHEQYMASFDVDNMICRVMAHRFKQIVDKRESALAVARLVRRARKTAAQSRISNPASHIADRRAAA